MTYYKVMRELDAFDLPWGKAAILQEVAYEGGTRFLRLRIREGTRFTIVDLDHGSARHLGSALIAWSNTKSS